MCGCDAGLAKHTHARTGAAKHEDGLLDMDIFFSWRLVARHFCSLKSVESLVLLLSVRSHRPTRGKGRKIFHWSKTPSSSRAPTRI